MRSTFWLTWMLLFAGVAPFTAAGPIRDPEQMARDLTQTVQARKLLHDDPDLAPLNIGVTVRNRVAILFGPVPSVEAVFRAELCLKTMIGLAEIRNELFVSDLVDPIPPPKKARPAPPNPPGVVPPILPREPKMLFSRPEVRLGQATPSKLPEGQMTTRMKPAIPRLEAPQPESPMPESELAAAVRKLLQSQSAFAKVQFRIEGRIVHLSAPEDLADVLQTAARAVAHLPGVEGIVLSETKGP